MTVLTEQQLLAVVAIAQCAGRAIMNIYKQEIAVVIKQDQTPVTQADLAAHQIIVSQLKALTPTIPILSEEAADISWQQRQTWSRYWLIDPLDGTKEFIAGNGEFTVNIALIEAGEPVLGVVYAPALAQCYYAMTGYGAWRQGEDSLVQLPLAVTSAQVIRVVGSRSHMTDEVTAYLQHLPEYQMCAVGSSLKFCQLAEGNAEIYPRLGLTSEWDTAAAHAVLECAGGKVSRYDDGKSLQYNQKSSLLNPYFIATAPHWREISKQ